MFSSEFLFILIIAALTWTGVGAITLIILLIKDWKKGELW